MKIQYCSDLHLEFKNNWEWIKTNPLIPVGDILIIAGDIDYLDADYVKNDFFKKISKQFEHIYLVPGNHEYYDGYDVATAMKNTHINLAKNISLVNNHSLKIGNVNFIFSTMWGLIGQFRQDIEAGVADFYRIKYKNEPFRAHHFNKLHKYAFDFIQKEVLKDGSNVVVTHHVPSDLCTAVEFTGSIINDAFCVDKTDFIKNANIDYWIYGHSHRNLPLVDLNGTKLITNQLGYTGHGEHLSFKWDSYFEI